MKTDKAGMSSISPAEIEILKILWECSPLSADEIIVKLDTDNSTHPRTVKTLLNRLVRKQAIGFEEKGRRYHYYSRIDRDEFYKQETDSFLNRYFDGQLSPLISFFSRERKLSEKDLQELQRLVAEVSEQEHD